MIVNENNETYLQCDCCKQHKIRIKSRCWSDIQAGIMTNGWDRRRRIQGWQDRCKGCWFEQDADALRAEARARTR